MFKVQSADYVENKVIVLLTIGGHQKYAFWICSGAVMDKSKRHCAIDFSPCSMMLQNSLHKICGSGAFHSSLAQEYKGFYTYLGSASISTLPSSAASALLAASPHASGISTSVAETSVVRIA